MLLAKTCLILKLFLNDVFSLNTEMEGLHTWKAFISYLLDFAASSYGIIFHLFTKYINRNRTCLLVMCIY